MIILCYLTCNKQCKLYSSNALWGAQYVHFGFVQLWFRWHSLWEMAGLGWLNLPRVDLKRKYHACPRFTLVTPQTIEVATMYCIKYWSPLQDVWMLSGLVLAWLERIHHHIYSTEYFIPVSLWGLGLPHAVRICFAFISLMSLCAVFIWLKMLRTRLTFPVCLFALSSVAYGTLFKFSHCSCLLDQSAEDMKVCVHGSLFLITNGIFSLFMSL